VIGGTDCDDVAKMKRLDEPVSIWAGERQCSWCPLNCVKAGVAVRIKQLCVSPEVARRLREIGFGGIRSSNSLPARPTSSLSGVQRAHGHQRPVGAGDFC
jgi:hypothetical protein